MQIGTDGQPLPVSGQTKTAVNVTAAAGGYIVLENMRLTIPQGALEQDTEITAEVTQGPFSAADSALPLGPEIKFSPAGLQFLKPVSLQLCYSASEATQKNVNEKSSLTVPGKTLDLF